MTEPKVLRITVPTTLASRRAERLATQGDQPRRKRPTGLLVGESFTIEQPMAARRRHQQAAEAIANRADTNSTGGC